MAVPLLALVALTVVEVTRIADGVGQVRSETSLATTAGGPTGLITRMQDERSWASLALSGLESSYEVPMAGYPETRAATDDALEIFRADIEAKGGAVEAAYRDAFAVIEDNLAALRQDIDADTGPRTIDNMPFGTQIYDRYSELIQGLLDSNSRLAPQVRDADLRQATELADLASHQIEIAAELARQTIVAATLSPNGIDTQEEVSGIARELSAFDRIDHQILTTTGTYADTIERTYPADLAAALHENVEAAISAGTMDNFEDFLAATTTSSPEDGYPGFRDAMVAAVTSRADDLNDEADARQLLFKALAIGALVLATAVTWLVSRSITRPLRSLTRQAKDMAEHRLPAAVRDILETPLGDDVQVPPIEPVAVKSRDEVVDVTDALNTVQTSAIDLAVEQAVLRRNIADSIVNLGRRNQNLLGRQLDFITELESNETDPDTLASLFRLDHLATRMRRNAESLLELAGIEPPRKWAAPINVTDVIRAALGEVEDYQRVRVEGVEPAMIMGSTAADLAHLLAELIENALTFSSPEDIVVVQGRWHGQDGFRVTVIDRGLGMADPAIVQANRRLAGTENFTVAPSKYLGHYVAGNLAARHGIGIRLEGASHRGIVATVDLPSHVLTSDAPTATPVPEAPAALPLAAPDGNWAGGAPAAPVPGPPVLAPEPAGSWPGVAPPGPYAQPMPVVAAPQGPQVRPDRMAPAAPATPPEPWRTTATGLPKRPSGPSASPAGDRAAALPSGELLAALTRHAHTVGPRGHGRAHGQARAAETGVTTRSGLTRRVSGAQLPVTKPMRLRHHGEPAAAGPSEGDGRGDDRRARPSTAADDVYSFLSGFTVGMQRGLDEMRRDREQPSD